MLAWKSSPRFPTTTASGCLIVVDNAESVTELLPVDSQVIRLVVSAEDESLRVEVDK